MHQAKRSCTLTSPELLEQGYVLCYKLSNRTCADIQTDDVAHTDAAFNKDTNPKSAAKGVEKEVSSSLVIMCTKADMSSLEKISRQTRLRTMTELTQTIKLERPTSHSTHRGRRLASTDRCRAEEEGVIGARK